MLRAIRKSDGQTVTAYDETKDNGPYRCPECGDPVILKIGRNRINHFAHEYPLATQHAEAESDEHRRCKMEIFLALQKLPNVSKTAFERPLGTNRPDVSAYINGVPVAIEIQISSLSIETIMQRTIDYHRSGVYVLWLLPWTPALDGDRFAPRPWEKWLHAAYFGRVYYWLRGLEVVSYRFEPKLKAVPKTTWIDSRGRKMTGGGYSRKLKRRRTAMRGDVFNLASDFVPRERLWWEGNGIKVPDAKLFMERHQKATL